jgi:type IV secretory pathway VirD2 relaxase
MQSYGGPEGKAELFTRADEAVDLERFLRESRHDPRSWTIILAPEHGNRLDIQAFTQRFMEQVETDTGLNLDYVAAVHTNTDHHHSHTLIRGRDQDGEVFRLAKEYIRSGFRARAMELQASWLAKGLTREPQQTQQPTQERTVLQRLER